uniref:Uncharacterized protein n=1 Tax=Anguilla anguilla TaxID=7936 RepID=A0A0E9XRV6_ANGAN
MCTCFAVYLYIMVYTVCLSTLYSWGALSDGQLLFKGLYRQLWLYTFGWLNPDYVTE